MVFDLGRAMRKKEEFESARLLDFEFRRRARATLSLARALGVDAEAAIGIAAVCDERAIPQRIAELAKYPIAEVVARFDTCLRQAHEQLRAERGDPTPHRMG